MPTDFPPFYTNSFAYFLNFDSYYIHTVCICAPLFTFPTYSASLNLDFSIYYISINSKDEKYHLALTQMSVIITFLQLATVQFHHVYLDGILSADAVKSARKPSSHRPQATLLCFSNRFLSGIFEFFSPIPQPLRDQREEQTEGCLKFLQ